jgi:hypothetical protein
MSHGTYPANADLKQYQLLAKRMPLRDEGLYPLGVLHAKFMNQLMQFSQRCPEFFILTSSILNCFCAGVKAWPPITSAVDKASVAAGVCALAVAPSSNNAFRRAMGFVSL